MDDKISAEEGEWRTEEEMELMQERKEENRNGEMSVRLGGGVFERGTDGGQPKITSVETRMVFKKGLCGNQDYTSELFALDGQRGRR